MHLPLEDNGLSTCCVVCCRIPRIILSINSVLIPLKRAGSGEVRSHGFFRTCKSRRAAAGNILHVLALLSLCALHEVLHAFRLLLTKMAFLIALFSFSWRLFSSLAPVVLAVILATYLIPHVLICLLYRSQNLKQAYNAEWALVTGASSGEHLHEGMSSTHTMQHAFDYRWSACLMWTTCFPQLDKLSFKCGCPCNNCSRPGSGSMYTELGSEWADFACRHWQSSQQEIGKSGSKCRHSCPSGQDSWWHCQGITVSISQ